MKDRSNALPAPVRALSAEAAKRWDALPPRERMGIGLAATVVGIALLWMVAVSPALRTLREAPAQISALDDQLQSMQRMAGEARELRGTVPVPAMQAGLALKSATDRLGERGRISIQGDRATLTLSGVTGETLRSWLAEVRVGARARPVEAQLTRGPQGYSGNIVVTIGGSQ